MSTTTPAPNKAEPPEDAQHESLRKFINDLCEDLQQFPPLIETGNPETLEEVIVELKAVIVDIKDIIKACKKLKKHIEKQSE